MWRPLSESAREMAPAISSAVSPQWNTEAAAVRPRWRIPMSTVGMCADGTSTIPLDELPVTAPICFSAER